KEAIRYPHALAGYILWLADNWEHLARTLPNTLQEARSQILESYAGHLRIPETMATLFIGLATGLAYAQEIGALTESQTQEWKERGWAALWDMAIGQSARIERERPTLIFLEVLSTLVAQGKARLYPKDSDKEFIPEPGTDLVGWYDEDFIYLLPEAAYHAVARFLREEGRHFPVKERALWKYLFEEGYLLRNEGDPHYTRRIRRGDTLHRVIQIIRSAAAEYFPATSMPSPIIPL
ncbi:MAG: hypothetical protein N2509_08565, partial [Treponemataceae bacterium]|nr:hypothetical protein [Treponemataceae bacterium]